MERYLELVVTIVTLTCAVAVTVNLVRLNSAVHHMNGIAEPEVVGKEIPVMKEVARNSNKSLLLFLKPSCQFCEESYGFYRRLIRSARDHDGAQVFGATTLPIELGAVYFEQAGRGIEHIFWSSQIPVPLRRTPTLLLLDQHATVVRSWVGKPSPVQESEVIEASIER